jgi:uncharacterized protein (TIGR03083 family)
MSNDEPTEAVMNEWNATDFAAKDNLLRVVRGEAEALFELAAAPGVWDRPTACTQWQVRDIVGHLIDVTEGYFTGFDAAASGAEAEAPLGLTIMAERLDVRARAHRDLTSEAALDRLRADFGKLMEMAGALGPDEWAGKIVAHTYMGPLPAFFYPVFQLMDYSVHAWDIRQGTGSAQGIDGDAADLLVPFMFILWQATFTPSASGTASIGIRVLSGGNAGDYLVSVSPEGLAYEAGGDVSEAPAVIEFDPGSLVLTVFGRVNGGTIRGDRDAAAAFLNSFFRI